jgi:hypothetical protein
MALGTAFALVIVVVITTVASVVYSSIAYFVLLCVEG